MKFLKKLLRSFRTEELSTVDQLVIQRYISTGGGWDEALYVLERNRHLKNSPHIQYIKEMLSPEPDYTLIYALAQQIKLTTTR
jgi:hypothetical protein